ncbi:MAG: glycosyltransferase [Dehalococcoidia bacterium]|nr:glycosyltransferase [Dehalococcoidia bacterium]
MQDLTHHSCAANDLKEAFAAQPGTVSRHPRRLALYSHDTMGLGHMRRNLAIAEALAASKPQPTILMIAGSREIGAFDLPACTDTLALPGLYKEANGAYRPRCLDVSPGELRAIRASIICAALEIFAPDALIVDKVPTGVTGELCSSLDLLRQKGRTRCVLGLRDVIDEPAVMQREWTLEGNYDAIRRYYDAVWVYGDPAIYDPVRAYGFPQDITSITCHTGYLGSMRCGSGEEVEEEFWRNLGLPADRLLVCTVGGGQDGARLAEAFIQTDLPPESCGVVITGPFMPVETKRRLHLLAMAKPQLRLVSFTARSTLLLQRAERIVTMGGYNTICEALSLGKRLLVVPRTSPRLEQLLRAERMRDLGLLDMLHPGELTPEALGRWLCSGENSHLRAKEKINLDGLRRLPELLDKLLASPSKVLAECASGRLEHAK